MAARLLAVLAFSSTAFPSAAAAAQRYALVVGVSGYPKPLTPLDGPRNDVTLLVNTLIETKWTGRDHIRILADDLAHAYYPAKVTADAPPTIGKIRDGFDWLTGAAGQGDEVIIYLSGHGSYVPSLGRPGEAPEPDGLDEVFLPLDIGGWSDALHGLKNQLADNEIAVFLAKLRAKGARVWLIADSCNSGTLSRAGVTVRSINPVMQLGVPPQAFESKAAAAAPSVRSIAPSVASGGAFVGFFAAQPSLDAIEVQVPLGGARREQRVHGLFTWYLVSAIRSHQTASFDRIARAIVAGYSEWQGAAPIAMFEGDLFAESGFSGQGGRLYSLASVNGQLAVKAGILDGIGPGTRFDLLDLRGAEPRKIGAARATSSMAERSGIEVDPARPGPADHAIAELRARPDGFGAEVTSAGLSLRLTVALDPLPKDARAGDRQAHDRAAAELSALLGAPESSQAIALAPGSSTAAPDVRLVIRGGRLWFAPPTGDLAFPDGTEPPSLEAAAIDDTGLARMLAQIGHGRNLLKAARMLEEARALNARVQVFRKPRTRREGACPNNARDQGQAAGTLAFDSAVTKDQLARFTDCDFVTVEISNQGGRSIGVTPLYVDAWSHIDFLPDYEGSLYSALVVDPGQTGRITYTESLPSGAQARRSGRANLVLLMTAIDGSQPSVPDYRSLATNATQPMRADTLDPTSSGFLLAAAGSGGGNLRSITDAPDSNAGAFVVPLDLGRKP